MNANTSYLSIGSQSKPPTLVREEFPQWKIRMMNFLEGIHPRITEFLHNPPFIPATLIPRVPATANTPEVPEYYQPKLQKDWSEEEKELASLAPKCKRLLIMALPNDIFTSLDHCSTSKELWSELLKQLEGGVTTLKNNRTLCINEYHEFKAKEGESLKDTYSRFNVLISKCRRSGVIRSNEDNNTLFLKSLGTEWLHLTMSMRTNMDLEMMSLADLYGSLASLEPQVLQLKGSIGGPLALVAEGGKGRGEKWGTEEKKKKKAVVIAKNDEEELSSEEEMSMKEMMKTLVSFTRDFRKGAIGGGRGRQYERKEESERRGKDDRKGDFDRSYDRRDEEQRAEETRGNPQRGVDGCFRCGKPGHYAAECWATGPMAPQKPNTPQRMLQKPKQDAAYFKKKADYYNKKVLMAQTSELVTDESSEEDEPQKGLMAFEDSDDETEFCGMARSNSDTSSTKSSEVSSDFKVNEL